MNSFSLLIVEKRKVTILSSTGKPMTILNLAIASGISPQSVFNIEHGNGCNLKSAFALCKALGITTIPVE